MTFYIFSQGTLSSADEVNYNLNKTFKLQSEKAINDVSATNSGVLAGSSQVLIDKFLDANGQNNTVNTGTTTAIYSALYYHYNCGYTIGGTSTESAEATMASSGSTNLKIGYRISVNNIKYLNSVIKHASCTATVAYLYLRTVGGEGTLFAQANFSGNTATFTSASGYLKLIPGNTYLLLLDNGGSSYTTRYDSTPSYPYSNTNVNFIDRSVWGLNEDTDTASNIVSITVGDAIYTDSIVLSSATTVPTGMTKVFVTPLLYEALATGDSITADVSIDNGAHYTTGVPINTWTPITSANGTQLIVKMNLNTASGVSSPKILGWRCLLE